MKSSPKVGTTGQQRFVVEPKHVIDFADGGMPAILCTPWLMINTNESPGVSTGCA